MANNDYITTDCKLTVSKNTAKLDEEIFLYKNDRNIKLLIEIVDNKYRYKSDDLSNLLVKYKASYAQVKWYKNAEVKKEFPIQATDDGKVVFVIEGQLIDEDTELGDYDLQLRLLNESQESIRSLPIIKGAVHILKPLFEEGDIATVNSAVADVSMLSLDGDAIDTYNSDGTYNQTNWGNGDVISSAKLNKLEKVAKDNVDKVNKMPAKSIVEGGKIYLAKEDGTKLDSGTELPAGGTGTSYDDTEIKSDINTIKTDLGTEELTTTAKTVKGAVNEVAAQYKEIANKQPTDLSLDSATNLLQLVNSKGSKLGNGITLPISSGGGTSQYLHIKYSSTGAPQLAGQISDTPNAYIGLCVDTNADSPTNPKNYTWYNWKGDNGDTGATPNLQIGTVTTLESGSNATASITGTTENPVLNLGIPKGDKGDTGASGTGTGGDTETWEKVIETTFGEECYAFTVTQDKDGNPLQLKEGFIFLTVSQPKDTGSNLLYGMGFSNWESSFNGKTNIYSIGLMKNYEFYRAAFYFKVINNYVFTQCLGNVRIGTTAPKYNVFTQPNIFNANTVSNFRVLTNSLEYVDKITVGLDMSTMGLFSADSIMEVWAKC